MLSVFVCSVDPYKQVPCGGCCCMIQEHRPRYARMFRTMARAPLKETCTCTSAAPSPHESVPMDLCPITRADALSLIHECTIR